MKTIKKTNKMQGTINPIAYDSLLCLVFKCKCGCNKFEYTGEIPEYTEDGFATGKVDDLLYTCINCGDSYFMSQLNEA